MKILTTLDNKTVCSVTSWPPRRNSIGHWELAVQGDAFVFDLLGDYQGCSFKVGEIEFCNLILIERGIIPPEDETEFPTMVFAGVMHSGTGTTGAILIGGNYNG